MYPASTTKILTAILTLEKGHLQDKTIVSKSALAEMKSGYATAYLVEGEELTIEELLELLLIHSANDTSNVLAEYISGSIPEFVNLMNNKLKELGCNNTHFVTTNGLHDDNHYTNLKDMATITRYCMKNADFRRIIAMPNCHIKSTNKSGERLFRNTNSLILPTSIYYYPGCIGGKTGFTSQAKNCLVSACNKNNMQLIAIVFGASKTEDHKSARYVDSKTLYDYAYSNYSFREFAKAYDVVKTIEVKNGTNDTKSLDLKLENGINAIVKNDFSENIVPEIVLNDKLSAPLSQNSIVGKAIYTINGEIYSSNLIASHNVEKDESLIYILRIVLVILIIILFLIVIIYIFIKIHRINKLKEATK
jgi:D-alanyl-D-alanine carboxypeptidase